MYKQIEFDEDVPRIRREIWCREKLQSFLLPDSLSPQHGVCPILALVVTGHPPRLCGLLMPNAGTPLVCAREGGLLRISHLLSLLEALKCLQAAKVVHGDICERNVCVDGPSIRLIDFGEVAPHYIGDIVTTGVLFQRVGEAFSVRETEKVYQAGQVLVSQGDLDAALSILG
jgi:hypothetical protein